MLSYMLPAVDDKSSCPSPRNLNLNLNLNGNGIPTNGNNPESAKDDPADAFGHNKPRLDHHHQQQSSSSTRLINFEPTTVTTRPSALKSAIPVASSKYSNNSSRRAAESSASAAIIGNNTNSQSHHLQSATTTNHRYHAAAASDATTTMATNTTDANRAKLASECDVRTHASNLYPHNQNNYHPMQMRASNNLLDNLCISSPAATTTTNSILSSDGDARKAKPSKAGNTKNMGLKRVSFGSSKGSMVETLVFETPTPLPEHAEREFAFSAAASAEFANANSYSSIGHYTHHATTGSSNSETEPGTASLDDSGIEISEELERSKVRVSFFQSGKPQQISPPDPFDYDFDHNQHPWKHFDPLDPTSASSVEVPLLSHQHNSSTMTTTQTTASVPAYDRQMSTESGWDNPFRPGGDLSREADEIVNMIKGGKPITPTGDSGEPFKNGNAAHENGHLNEASESISKIETSLQQAALNGKTPLKNGHDQGVVVSKSNGDNAAAPGQTQISNQVVPGPQSATHVIVDDKKKKKCTCCVIQ